MSKPDDSHSQRPMGPIAPDSTDYSVQVGKSPERPGWQRGFANAWMVFAAAPAGLGIGYVVDRTYGTAPWWMLGLSLLFLAVSLYQLVKDSLK